jgi:hypothetical protein
LYDESRVLVETASKPSRAAVRSRLTGKRVAVPAAAPAWLTFTVW